MPDTDELQEDAFGYWLTQQNLDGTSPAVKVVGEELELFLSRARGRLNEITDEPLSEDELSKMITKLVSFRLGNPTARTIISAKRSSTLWNEHQKKHSQSVKAQLRISPFFQFFLLTLSIAANAGRHAVTKKNAENYKARLRADDVSNGSTTSSRHSMPSVAGNTPSPKGKSPSRKLGDALIPERSHNWQNDRMKHWTNLKRTVSR